jgi:hypothetical protein
MSRPRPINVCATNFVYAAVKMAPFELAVIHVSSWATWVWMFAWIVAWFATPVRCASPAVNDVFSAAVSAREDFTVLSGFHAV